MSVSPVAAQIPVRREIHRAVPLYRAIPGVPPSRRANAASTRPSGGDIFTEQLEGHFHWTATRRLATRRLATRQLAPALPGVELHVLGARREGIARDEAKPRFLHAPADARDEGA